MTTTTLTPTSATTDSPKLIKKASSTAGDMKSPMTATQASCSCQHINGLLDAARERATAEYTRIIQGLRREGSVSGRLRKTGETTRTTPETSFLCLQCPSVTKVRERHKKEHAFSVESTNGFIFCHQCKDFIYHPTFESIRSSSNAKKRKHSALQTTDDPEADEDLKRLLAANSTATPCAATGLRGLYNMGQTCFMSVILQSVIHNPLIRTFYLSEGHRSSDCEREACTSCALDDIFTDFFGQEKHEGYGAVHMLQGCWKGGGGLAGYSQQDAHEYLGFILNSLHAANTAKAGEEDGPTSSQSRDANTKDCECVVHQTFGGMLKSTVTCSKCKNVTTALDPFMDLSLDVRNSAATTPTVVKKKKLPLTNGTQTIKEAAPVDLTECLDRFTSTETLSSDSYTCRKCASAQEAKKKLSLARLPPVVPIHLKRFSHSKTLAQSSKVETRIRFPISLDLTPYTSSSSSKSKMNGSSNDKLTNGTTTAKDEDKDAETAKNRPAVYELSSVVVHKGKIDNGHYISYSRQRNGNDNVSGDEEGGGGEDGEDEWFRFDDSMVVLVDEREVLGAEAYMLFYVVREI